MYLRNSQPSRDLPVPAGPDTRTSRGTRRSAAAWKSSLTVRSSASRPVSGASSPSTRCEPPAPASTRVARHNRTGSALPFSWCSPVSANPTALPASRYVAPSTSTCPGSAAAWTRAAVFTASPATIPSPVAPRVTATSPVTTPARADKTGASAAAPTSATAATRSSAARTARSASPSVAAGAPHTAITASPMNFSTTPPYRLTTVRATAKYSDSSSRTASGSRDSDSGVKPTTSQNSTEHTRRSATGSAFGRGRRRSGPGDSAGGPSVRQRGTAGPAETIAGSNRLTARRATAGRSTAPPAEPVALSQQTRRTARTSPNPSPRPSVNRAAACPIKPVNAGHTKP